MCKKWREGYEKWQERKLLNVQANRHTEPGISAYSVIKSNNSGREGGEKRKYKSTNQSGYMQLHKCNIVGQQIVELGRESFCRITSQINNKNRPPQNK